MNRNPRVFLWFALVLVLWLNYTTWQKDFGPESTVAITQARQTEGGARTQQPLPELSATVPQASTSVPGRGSASPSAQVSPAVGNRSDVAVPGSSAIQIHTDVFDLEINLQGGTLQRTDLLRYPKVKGGSEPVRLLNRDNPQSLYLLQSGLTGPKDGARPTHLAQFASTRSDYELEDAVELRVPLVWSSGDGVTVTKTFIFRRGQYRINLEYEVQNHSGQAWQAAEYAQILRNEPPTKLSMFEVESYAFHGPALYDGTKYRKLDIEDADDRRLALEVRNGWVAALQHHFVGAIVPPTDAEYRFTLSAQERSYLLAAAGTLVTVPDGGNTTFKQTLFIGPKLQAQLAQTGPELHRVADYGKLTILAKPLFWLLGKVHALFGNWGWAIVVVTLLLKLLFYPLSEASGKSMAKMKSLAPRIKNLQETYKDDREKLARATMEIYQREKVNPVAGCLPMLIQIPVFLAFYWVLLESVEMRQAPFIGWIDDLSSRDPFFILPAIMAAAMFAQYKLNPKPPDPIQAKVFMIMPLAMSAMFAFFPAGLVLYWVTNTVLSIAQQWNINRRIERGKKS